MPKGTIHAHGLALEDARRRLVLDGYSFRWTCIACPVQAEGTLPTGDGFYFRERHGEAIVEIWRGRLPNLHPDWPPADYTHDGSDLVDVPSWCSADRAEAILRRATSEWTRINPSASPRGRG